jgi:predicted glutamine amidotransferase
MCRLFGLTAGTARVRATFWLLDAPDSLEVQSLRNADGSGIGYFDATGAPVIDKQPEPAFADEQFIHEAKEAESATFVAHVRLASSGGRTMRNTHPFVMRGRIMAHNGGFDELERIDEQLGSYASLVKGETDSERYFALITKQIDAHDGDVGTGIVAAARWIGANLPVSSLNTVVATDGELWALRYPSQHALHIIERPASGATRAASDGMHVRSATSSVHVPALHWADAVVVASERLDGESGWRMLEPGELVHVRRDLTVTTSLAVAEPPRRLVPIAAGNPNIDT